MVYKLITDYVDKIYDKLIIYHYYYVGIFDTNDLSDVVIGIYSEWFNDSDVEIKNKCKEVVDLLIKKGFLLKHKNTINKLNFLFNRCTSERDKDSSLAVVKFKSCN